MAGSWHRVADPSLSATAGRRSAGRVGCQINWMCDCRRSPLRYQNSIDGAFSRLGMAAIVQETFVEPVGTKSYLYADRLRDNLLRSGWKAIYNRLQIDRIASAKDKALSERAPGQAARRMGRDARHRSQQRSRKLPPRRRRCRDLARYQPRAARMRCFIGSTHSRSSVSFSRPACLSSSHSII